MKHISSLLLRALYSGVFYLAIPLILIRLLWRARRQADYLAHIGERFGFYPAQSEAHDASHLLWLHAVSVGEMRAAQPLIVALRAAYPDCRLLLTCMTPTGRETAQTLYGSFAQIIYLPYDLPFACARFFKHFQPRVGVIMETEIWPNLLASAKHHAVPTALVNARLSEKSARGYRRISRLSEPALAALSAVGAQSPEDAQRLNELGATSVSVCGNLKFDVTPNPECIALGESWRDEIGTRPVWLCASTREGEEGLLLEAFAALRTHIPNALLLIVPRHPQRFDEVALLVKRAGFSLTRRSTGFPDKATAVWLGDSMGEMVAYYACADLALIGGSLMPFGAQNLIEACACGCPVLIGPSDFNFRQATRDALVVGAALRVSADPDAIAAALVELFGQGDKLAGMREKGLSYTATHRGATARTLALLKPLIERR